MEGKNCTKCGEWKVLTDFPPRKDGKHGRSARCKVCTNAAVRAKRAACPNTAERARAAVRKWNAKNKAHVREYDKQRYPAVRDRQIENALRWNRDNPDKAARARKEWDARNPGKIRRAALSNYYRRSERLTDGFIANHIFNLPASALPPELIEAKRIQLQIHRYLKETDNGN